MQQEQLIVHLEIGNNIIKQHILDIAQKEHVTTMKNLHIDGEMEFVEIVDTDVDTTGTLQQEDATTVMKFVTI